MIRPEVDKKGCHENGIEFSSTPILYVTEKENIDKIKSKEKWDIVVGLKYLPK